MLQFSLLLLIAAMEPRSVTMEEFFRGECDNGNQQACARLRDLSAGLVVQKRLQERSEKFWTEINTAELILDGKPDLQAAYPLVMRDFINAKNQAGGNEKLDEQHLSECARHYHNHWLNKKLWYPAHDDGTPDWPSIYVYIVDHYYGFCLKHP